MEEIIMSDLLERMKEASVESNVEVRKGKDPALFEYSADGSVILGFSDEAKKYFKTVGAKFMGSVWGDGRNIPGVTHDLRLNFSEGYIVNGIRMTDEGFALDVNLSDLERVNGFTGFPKSEVADGQVYLESIAIRSSQKLVESGFTMPYAAVKSVMIYKDDRSDRSYVDCVNEWFKYAISVAGDGKRLMPEKEHKDQFVTITLEDGGYVALGHNEMNLGFEAKCVDVSNEIKNAVRADVDQAKKNGLIQGQSIKFAMGVRR